MSNRDRASSRAASALRRTIALEKVVAAGGGSGSSATWASITGKPTTFPPSAHGHLIGDVTGLQSALDGKQAAGSYASAAHSHIISDVTGLQAALDGKQIAGSYAAASHTHIIADVTGLQTALDAKAPLASPTFTGTVSGITKGMVGLGSVDNTADSAKPVSTAQQAALDLKAPLAGPTFTGTLTAAEIRGTGRALFGGTSFVGGAVPKFGVIQTAADWAAQIEGNTASGNSYGVRLLAGTTGADFALLIRNAGNTTTLLQLLGDGALSLPGAVTFGGAVTGLTKAMVGLGNVDNTSDAGKPVSTAQQTALDLKAPLASPGLTGNPTAPTQAAGDNSTKLATTAYARAAAPNASYRTLLDCSGSHTAARAAGTYWLAQSDAAGVSGTGTLYPPNLIYIDPADFPSIDGLAAKLRLRVVLAVNDVAPTGNYTFGLYPVTTPATSGGAGLRIWTVGTVVTGSTVAVNTPAADSANNLVGSDFAVPAAGLYVIGFVSTAAVAASSHLHISSMLQQRNA